MNRLLVLLCLLPMTAVGQVSGDANCDGVVNAADVTAVIDAIYAGGSDCAAADTNTDGVYSAGDLSGVIRRFGPSPRPSRTPTATLTAPPTLTPTVTQTPFPTPASDCPSSGAELSLDIDDRSAGAATQFSSRGRLLRPTCRNTLGLTEHYELVDVDTAATVQGLAPGLWVHTLASNLGQEQHQGELIVAGSAPNQVSFTVFASVITVQTTVDRVGAGSLRDALTLAASLPSPLLIQFDEGAFPPGRESVIRLVRVLPQLTASNVTIDGTDSLGLVGARVIDVAGRNSGALSITGSANTIIGLGLRNAGGNDRDLLSISGAAAQANRIESCRIDNAATGDGVGIDSGAGTDFEVTANVIHNCEISAAGDKGVKVTTNSYVRLEGSLIRDNANGGVQATLSGHLRVVDNVIERSGGASAQNGLSANGISVATPDIPSDIFTDGNIIRSNGANGISVRGYSRAVVRNDYVSNNNSSGIRIFDQGIVPAAAGSVEGATFACNAINGAVVADSSNADFGGGSLGSLGNNAFTQTGETDANLRNSSDHVISARNNQWEHCGREPICDQVQIEAHDLSDHGRRTDTEVSQAHRSGVAPVLSSLRPSKGIEGTLIRVFGQGFNAIDAHADGVDCPDLRVRNSCVPLRGNCVRIGGVPAVLEAVTPTMLVVRMPFPCVEPTSLTVQTQGGGLSEAISLCANPPLSAAALVAN